MSHQPYLKSIAHKSSAYNGAVTFYILRFPSLKVQVATEALNRVQPRYMWVNDDTGERTTQEPPDYREVVQYAQQAKAAKLKTFARKNGDEPLTEAQLAELDKIEQAATRKLKWRVENQWSDVHDAFLICVTDTVDIEFNIAEDTPPEVEALQAYWQHQNGSVENNWNLFIQLVNPTVANRWWLALAESRDLSMSAPEEIQSPIPADTDPQPSSGG